MINNFKKEFKPYLETLRQDNKSLKEYFNNDTFVFQR